MGNTLFGGFENLIDSWSGLWTSLESFWELFSFWLPADIVSAISVLLTVLLALACWRVFKG